MALFKKSRPVRDALKLFTQVVLQKCCKSGRELLTILVEVTMQLSRRMSGPKSSNFSVLDAVLSHLQTW